jgi:glycosyltransferase involved in cell wall biosynthesis
MCAYNEESTVARALSSLISPKQYNYEIIFVDDGSTDNTLKIAKSIAINNKEIKIFSTINTGLGSARNFGIKKSQGEYITFCDGDDIFLSLNQAELINKQLNLDIICLTGYKFINNNEMTLFNDSALVSGIAKSGSAELIKKYKFLMEPSVCTKFFKKDFVLRNGIGFTEGRLFEDVEFTYKALMLTDKIACINLPVFIYCVNSESITSSKSVKRIDIFHGINSILKQISITQPFSLAENTILLISIIKIVKWCYDESPDEIKNNFIQMLQRFLCDFSDFINITDESISELLYDDYTKKCYLLMCTLYRHRNTSIDVFSRLI